MHVIIIGAGKVGIKFAQLLSDEGHDVSIVDNDKNAFKLLDSNFNGITVSGVPIDQDVLKQAGIETADALAAVTPDDNVNVMVSQVAKEIFKVPKVIARIYNPHREHVFHAFGLDTICPTELTVQVMYSKLIDSCDIMSHNIGKNTVAFKNVPVDKKYIGKRLASVKLKKNERIIGILRDEDFQFEDPMTTIMQNDYLVIATKCEC